jgi:hypothetical protein
MEFETNQKKPIALIMQNEDHHWIKASSAADLLPYSFSKQSLDGPGKK